MAHRDVSLHSYSQCQVDGGWTQTFIFHNVGSLVFFSEPLNLCWALYTNSHCKRKGDTRFYRVNLCRVLSRDQVAWKKIPEIRHCALWNFARVVDSSTDCVCQVGAADHSPPLLRLHHLRGALPLRPAPRRERGQARQQPVQLLVRPQVYRRCSSWCLYQLVHTCYCRGEVLRAERCRLHLRHLPHRVRGLLRHHIRHSRHQQLAWQHDIMTSSRDIMTSWHCHVKYRDIMTLWQQDGPGQVLIARNIILPSFVIICLGMISSTGPGGRLSLRGRIPHRRDGEEGRLRQGSDKAQ